jgi:hypothetical protein
MLAAWRLVKFVQSVPVMVHPSDEHDEHGTALRNMQVVTPDKLEELKLAVRAHRRV